MGFQIDVTEVDGDTIVRVNDKPAGVVWSSRGSWWATTECRDHGPFASKQVALRAVIPVEDTDTYGAPQSFRTCWTARGRR